MSRRRRLGLRYALLACTLPSSIFAQGNAASRPDLFATATEARLDSLYAPLVYIMREGERGLYATLSLAGKRDFLRRFWAKRDPDPHTPRNEAEETFNARVVTVNRKFTEHGKPPVPGWRTDRGRIYLKYGKPDVTLIRRGKLEGLPFEVWRYSSGTRRKYCFVDLTGFGNYSLVYSSDPAEPTRGDWRELLGWEAYGDVMSF